MKRTTSLIISLILAATSACGTRDYPKVPGEYGQPVPPRQNEPRAEVTARPRLTTEGTGPGYLWGGMRWTGISANKMDKLRCSLADGADASRIQAFSTSLVSGAVIGVIGRFSGAWLFGKPQDTPPEGHWFWNNLDHTIRNLFGGVGRGAFMVGACQTLLAGGNLTWFSGVLGQDFSALSAAIATGGFASIVATPFIRNRFGQPPPRPVIAPEPEAPRNFLRHLKQWSSTSDIGQGVRYKFIPGVTILGIGGGFGYLIYERLAGHESPEPSCKEDQTLSSDRMPESG